MNKRVEMKSLCCLESLLLPHQDHYCTGVDLEGVGLIMDL